MLYKRKGRGASREKESKLALDIFLLRMCAIRVAQLLNKERPPRVGRKKFAQSLRTVVVGWLVGWDMTKGTTVQHFCCSGLLLSHFI
jgi:hypothetical protein